MKFERLAIRDIVLCTPQILKDERGYFLESFRKDLLENFLGFSINFCQENESYSKKGVFRGLALSNSALCTIKIYQRFGGGNFGFCSRY